MSAVMSRSPCRRRTSFDYLVTGGRVGDAVALTVWRDRQEVELELTLQVFKVFLKLISFYQKQVSYPAAAYLVG
eukprot:COSAG01_NODE_26767_length_704_cov_0.573554_1_plen_74_part_00